ncbi:MAG: YbaB/EbfC family nucleoid-associated protein [Candidatus Omnitrophica bacterium]|nr:YbaB/EbfC family nucleoid-associated protein [Candidatus Omnitrophota bacterium]
MFDQMKKLMEMKQQAEKIKRQLEASRVEMTDVDGIKIVVDGAQKFHLVEIDEHFLTAQEKQNLEKELLRSLNKAMAKSQSLAADQMKNLLGPGMPSF